MLGPTEIIYRGIGVSPGIAHGKVLLLGCDENEPIIERPVSREEIPFELARFERALSKTRTQLLGIQSQIEKAIGAQDASIFDAHLLVLEDPTLLEEVQRRLHSEMKCVEYIFAQVGAQYINTLTQIEDHYLRERAADLRDVVQRMLRNLTGKESASLQTLPEPRIILAYDLSPSDTAMMKPDKVIGFATDIGSRTSHTAIMARSLEIPAVVGLHDVIRHIKNGSYVLLDGYAGLLILNPGRATLDKYEKLKSERTAIEKGLERIVHLPAVTRDEHRIVLSANIELVNDLDSVKEHGAEGIGLYRTEFFYINRKGLPSEEEQFHAYEKVARALHPQPVIIRTLDLGGDKFVSHLEIPTELNPFLGWRAIRFCLERLDIFEVQLRAILRASAVGNVSIMYPMISGVGEIRAANQVLNRMKEQLRREGKPFNENVEVGAMIEVPSAAVIAEIIAEEADFLSIGTNDLIQYTLAVDRVNEKIAHLYQPTHPAIIRLIQYIVEAAHKKNKKVSICGEMAGEPLLAPLLVGLGVDNLSMSAVNVPRVKEMIRGLTYAETRQLIQNIQLCRTDQEILAACEALARKAAPAVLELDTYPDDYSEEKMETNRSFSVLILAAGYATRLYPLTLNKAKPLLEVAGKPMVEHVLDQLLPVPGLNTIHVVTNHKFAKDFEEWSRRYKASSGTNRDFRITDDQSTSDENKLGAIGDMHLVINKHQLTNEDLIVVAGDNLFDRPLTKFVEFAKRVNGSVVGTYDVGDPELVKKYNNISVDASGRVNHFEEKPKVPTSTVSAIALYYFKKEHLALMNEYIEQKNNPDQPGRFIQWLYQRASVYACPIEGMWYDIGSKETLEEANRIFSNV